MEKRALGRTGLHVSLISFGCVELGIPYGIGVKDEDDMLPEEEAVSLLQTALARGINFFDTAAAYGRSEAILGKAFEDCRDDVVICTKCPGLTGPDGTILPTAALRDKLRQSLEKSLEALRMDVVDVYMLHQSPACVVTSDEVASVFADLKTEGLIRASGASTYPGGETPRVIESGRWDVIQLAFNLMDQRETQYLAAAEAAGIGVVVRSVLLKGILTDRGRNLHPALERVTQHREQFIRSAPDGLPLSDYATRYALSKPGVSSVLVGIDRLEYLEKALAVGEAGPLAPEKVREADALAFPDPQFLNLHQWDVNGWLT